MIRNYWRRKLLRKIARRNGWRCFCGICGGKLTLDEATLDHIIPRSLGGSNHPSNLQMAHGTCNWNKGNKLMPLADAPPGSPEYQAKLEEMFDILAHSKA